MREAAAEGTRGAGEALPHREAIQHAFGRHDVSGVTAHTGDRAAAAAASMGAQAYTIGNDIAFGSAPSLQLAAHEAAHVIQQRAGVHLKGGVGEVGDAYERHADAVADLVTRGESAEALLDTMAGPPGSSGAHAVQRKVGFELQTQVSLAGAGTRSLQEGAPLVTKGDWHIVADDLTTPYAGDLEFVTAPFFDETTLTTTLQQIAGVGRKIDALEEATPLASLVSGAPEDVTVTPPQGSVSAAPQATFDVPLSKVVALMEEMNKPTLGKRFGAKPEDPATHSMAGQSVDDAQLLAEVGAFVRRWFDESYEDSARYSNLQGLTALVLSYIVAGAQQPRRFPYAKLIAPVLARTSFSSMWAQLNKAEKDLFLHPVDVYRDDDEEEEDDLGNASEEEDEVELESAQSSDSDSADTAPPSTIELMANHFRLWISDLVGELEEERAQRDASARPSGLRVYAHGYRDDDKVAAQGPATGDWLRSIVDPEGEDQEKDLMSPPEGGSASMGALQAKRQEAVLELRRLPKQLPVDQWLPFASHILGLYDELLAAAPRGGTGDEPSIGQRYAKKYAKPVGNNIFDALRDTDE